MKSKVVSIAAIAVALLSIGITRGVAASSVGNSSLATGAVDSRVIQNGSIMFQDINSSLQGSLQHLNVVAGYTVAGVIGGDYEVQPGTNCPNNCDFGGYASLPFPARTQLNDGSILVTNKTWVNGGGQTKPTIDPSDSRAATLCTGSLSKPTAPRGYVCVYIAGGDNAVNVKGVSVIAGTGGSPYGFKIVWVAPNMDDTFIDAVWAYHA